MKIRNDLAKTVLMEFVSDTFSRFEFNIRNVGNLIAAKLYINNNFDDIVKFVSKDGYIDITMLEDTILDDINKLGKFEIPAVGTKYIFNSDDVKRLISRMKEHADE